MVKEADTLSGAGYDVTVLYAYWNAWATSFDRELVPSKKWKAACVGGDPHQKPGIYFLSRLIYKMAKFANKKIGGGFLADVAIARPAYFLTRAAKKHPADLYIGHNLGALPATVKAAKEGKKPCGFDAEDFHRNEVSDNVRDPDVILRTSIEDKYIPQINYFTASSPLIAAAYKKSFPLTNPVAIRNVFPISWNIETPVIDQAAPVKLFWFSQTIGMGRGLEDIIKALGLLQDCPFELHLLGNLPQDAKKAFNTGSGNFYFHEPIPAAEIPMFAAQFDIGLSPEANVPLSRDMCLTNKIFTYMQAGLAIIASDTSAQKELLAKYPGIGEIYENGNVASLLDTIRHFCENHKNLCRAKKASWEIARSELNWEKESEKFLELIAVALTS